jgi:hypothetical protein
VRATLFAGFGSHIARIVNDGRAFDTIHLSPMPRESDKMGNTAEFQPDRQQTSVLDASNGV